MQMRCAGGETASGDTGGKRSEVNARSGNPAVPADTGRADADGRQVPCRHGQGDQCSGCAEDRLNIGTRNMILNRQLGFDRNN